MTIPYSTGKSLSIDQLTNVNITDVENNDVLQYNSTTGEWDNGSYVNPYFLSIGFNDATGTLDVPEGVNTFPQLELNLTRFPNQSPQGDYPTTGADAYYWTPSQTGIYLLTCSIDNLLDYMSWTIFTRLEQFPCIVQIVHHVFFFVEPVIVVGIIVGYKLDRCLHW